MSSIALRPWHYASVSGGKDSLYMLRYILENQDKYPLDAVVHFELEIDYPFVLAVTSRMEEMCKEIGVQFIRLRPRTKFTELLAKYGPPSRVTRWCNSAYKLDCKRQLTKLLKEQQCTPIAYIGYCADETKRIKPNRLQSEIYPLVELGITEPEILEWARTKDIFNGYYKYVNRQGCMVCPMMGMKALAYIRKFYPEWFDYVKDLAQYSETVRGYTMFDRPIDNILRNLQRSKYNL